MGMVRNAGPVGLGASLELRDLRCFHVVARTRSFSLAAKELRIQQPAVSKAVARLEQGLGAPLFVREHRGVILTDAAVRLVPKVGRILQEMDGVADVVDQEKRVPAGDVYVATSDHIATYLLPPAVARGRSVFPDLNFRIMTGAAASFVPDIVAGRFDFGIFFKMEKDPRLERRTIARAPCQVVVAKRLRDDAQVLRSFIGSRELDDPANKSFPTVKMLAKKRPGTGITLSCTCLEAHKAFVKEGCGVSILPLFVVEAELAEGSLVVIEPRYEYVAGLDLVVAKGRELSLRAKAALQLMTSALREHPRLSPPR